MMKSILHSSIKKVLAYFFVVLLILAFVGAYFLYPLYVILPCFAVVACAFIQPWLHLRRKGFWVQGAGRDEIRYEEWDGKAVRSFKIIAELMASGPRIVSFPTDAQWDRHMPEWARGRKAEMMERVKGFLGDKDYTYEGREHKDQANKD